MFNLHKAIFRCFCPNICSFVHPFLQPLGSSAILNHISGDMLLEFGYFHCLNMRRCCTVSPPNQTVISRPPVEDVVRRTPNVRSVQQKLDKRNYFPQDLVLEIIEMIRNNEKDLDSELSMVGSMMSVYSVTQIFEILNSQRMCGLRFFEWIWSNSPLLHRNARICSLIIDNLGRLEDYDSMLALVKKFSFNKICLMYEAFGFLPVLVYDSSLLKDSTKRVVGLLKEAGGSSQKSGVHALVEMFCKLDMLEIASYVIKITESRESNYFLLIREKCRRGLVEDARGIIREMGVAKVAPTTRVYNCLLGSLYKNGRMDDAFKLLDEMKEIGILPDEITFEILIRYFCAIGEMSEVHQFLDQMVSEGLQPRLETHAAIVKSLCAVKKYEAAHKYVVDSSVICKKTCSNTLYSLLGKLYLGKGDITSARHILLEMMDKGIKPNFCVYVKIMKQLIRTGRRDLARDLEYSHAQFLPSFRS